MTRVLVIGLDGATWDLINPLAYKGVLPTFKKLMENGVWGVLKSCIPPITIPAWACMMTGKNPGKIGTIHFLMRAEDSYEFKPVKLHLESLNPIWKLLNSYGRKVNLFYVPSIIPKLSEFNGMYVPGEFVFSGVSPHPPEVKELIKRFKKQKKIRTKGASVELCGLKPAAVVFKWGGIIAFEDEYDKRICEDICEMIAERRQMRISDAIDHLFITLRDLAIGQNKLWFNYPYIIKKVCNVSNEEAQQICESIHKENARYLRLTGNKEVIQKTITTLRDKGIMLILITSATSNNLNLRADILSVDLDLFDEIITSDEVNNPFSKHEYFRIIRETLSNIVPKRVLVVSSDVNRELRYAKEEGFTTILFRSVQHKPLLRPRHPFDFGEYQLVVKSPIDYIITCDISEIERLLDDS